MGERDHRNLVEVRNERETIREFAVVNAVRVSADGRCKLVPLNFSIKETIQIRDIQAARSEFPVRLRHQGIFLLVFHRKRLRNVVVDRIEVALVHVLATADFEAVHCKAQFHVFVVDLDLVFANYAEVVHVVPEFLVSHKEGVNGTLVDLILESDFLQISVFLE